MALLAPGSSDSLEFSGNNSNENLSGRLQKTTVSIDDIVSLPLFDCATKVPYPLDATKSRMRWPLPKLLVEELCGGNGSRLSAIIIRGNSMNPTLMDSDLAILDIKIHNVTRDGIYIIHHSGGLVGQIRQNEKSAQLTFPHEGEETGEALSNILVKISKQYMESVSFANGGSVWDQDAKYNIEVDNMWTIHSYEGDYNPMHDHGTRTSMGLSVILYLKVPPQIEALDNPAVDFKGLNGASGAVDGFTYLQWGTNGMRDANMLRPITEEYVKPEVGTMIMFPAWLRHGVMPFFGEGERRTFSANINITPSQEWAQAQYNDLKHKGKV